MSDEDLEIKVSAQKCGIIQSNAQRAGSSLIKYHTQIKNSPSGTSSGIPYHLLPPTIRFFPPFLCQECWGNVHLEDVPLLPDLQHGDRSPVPAGPGSPRSACLRGSFLVD